MRGNESSKEMKRRRFTSKAQKAFISLLDLFPLAPANRPWVSEDGNLLVRDAFKLAPLELAMSSFLVCLFWVVLLECTTSSNIPLGFKV